MHKVILILDKFYLKKWFNKFKKKKLFSQGVTKRKTKITLKMIGKELNITDQLLLELPQFIHYCI